MPSPLLMFINHNERLLRQAQLALTGEGFRVVSWKVSEGAEAVIESERPEVVILDLWLERSDAGWELFQSIRKNPAIQDVPVIITVEDSGELDAKRPEIGGDDSAVLFKKPYDWDACLRPSEQC